MQRPSHRSVRLRWLYAALAASILVATLPIRALAAPGDITTVGGTGTCCGGGADGDGGPVLQAHLQPPYGLVTAPGKYYFSENEGFFNSADVNRVRVVQNGTVNSVAGGVYPPSTDGVLATQTFLRGGGGVVADTAGDFYISDNYGSLRKVDATTRLISTVLTGISGVGGIDGAGNIYVTVNRGSIVEKFDPSTGVTTTVAGGGHPADGIGDGGPATSARFETFGSLAFDAAGDIYIGDYNNGRVRFVDAATGIITTVAGGGSPADGIGDGGPATSAQLAGVEGVALDSAGNLYIGDSFNNRIRKVDTGGTISTVAGGGPQTSQCMDTGDGGPATSATTCSPNGPVIDAAGNLYFTDGAGTLIRKVDGTGTITTIAGKFRVDASFGDAGPASAAEFLGGLAGLDPADGGLLVDDYQGNRIREIDRSGMITTVAGGGVGDGLPALSTMLNNVEGIALDPSGNLVIADCGDNRVRKVDQSGIMTSIAGTSGVHSIGDGGAATAAGLECPSAVAYDSAGNLFIADSGHNRVRRVDASGVITTVAGTGAAGFGGDAGPATSAQLSAPAGLVFDPAGNLYIADHDNSRVRKVDTTGTITTYAGNGTNGGSVDGRPATSGPVVWPVGLAIGPDGNLKIAESGFASIRSVDAKGYISTIAGNGIPGYSGDGGPANVATLDGPMGIAYDSSGNLLVADNQNRVIRSVAPGSPPPPPIATKKTASCGMTVTQNLTLANDIGPCPGDGLIIGGNGIHLDLNGHTITGSYGHSGQTVGIRATSRKDVKISNGTVTGFDAGVALISGSNNIVTGMTVANNVGGRNTGADTFGDGIVMFASSRNTITGNSVLHNGPFDGIAMIGQGADYNLIQNNTVKDTTNLGLFFLPGTGLGIVTNPFLGFDRPRMVSLNANQILGNTVINNDSAGISTVSNLNGVVRSNLAEHNGYGTPFGGAAFPGNGIGVTAAHNATQQTHELVENNQVIANGRDGIQVVADYNQILNNIGTGNRGVDFRDFDRTATFQPTCLNNTWSGNQWGTGGFYPQCASNGGSPLPNTTPVAEPESEQGPDDLGDPPARQSPS